MPATTGGYLLAEALWISCLPIVEQLWSAGVRAYCPVILERRRNEKRGTHTVRTPAFGGYFWLPCDNARIPETIAIRFRLFYRNGFSWFSDGVIDRMRETEAGWPIVREGHRTRFKPGTSITVVAGPFQGATGTVKDDRGERIRANLGGFTVDLPPFMVEEYRARS